MSRADSKRFIVRKSSLPRVALTSPNDLESTCAVEGLIRRVCFDQIPDARDLEHTAILQTTHLLYQPQSHQASRTRICGYPECPKNAVHQGTDIQCPNCQAMFRQVSDDADALGLRTNSVVRVNLMT